MFLVGMFKLSDLNDFYDKDPEYCSNRELLKPCECFYTPNGAEKVETMVNGKFNVLNFFFITRKR